MKGIVTSIKRVSEIINKEVDVTDRMGTIIYSSDAESVGRSIKDIDLTLPLDRVHRLYIHIENGSHEQLALVQMILQDRSFEGTADNYQQFLINILEGEKASEAGFEKFKIKKDASYIVYCIRPAEDEHFNDAYSLILNSLYGNNKSYVIPYKTDILIIEIADAISDEVKSNAKMIKDMINSEIYTDVFIGISDAHKGIMNIKESLSEALEAIEVGMKFNLPDNIYISKDMLIEKVVSLIPEDKAKELAGQVFKTGIDEIMDSEMLKTMEVFFKNNLNISDSSKILYIHRNTLLYRLDKIQKATGLDIRKFEDAIILKIGYLLKNVEVKHEHKTDAKS